MSNVSFEQIFKSNDSNRDKFLSRIFGIFSEKFVHFWCECPQSPYKDLGRPTIKLPDEKRGYTLDFSFQSKQDGNIFIGELKCELEYENYKYLTLASPSQLDHHNKEAFKRFLDIGKNNDQYKVTINNKIVSVSGAILVWGSITPEGRRNIINYTGLADVLSLEQIINDLINWNNQDYIDFNQQRETWCQELFIILGRKVH